MKERKRKEKTGSGAPVPAGTGTPPHAAGTRASLSLLPRISFLCTVAVFVLAVFLLLLCSYSTYMQKMADLTYFAPGSDFLRQCMQCPGGIVTWLSSALTCTLASPIPGAAVYTCLLTLLWWATAKACRLHSGIAVAAVVPSALSLLYILNLGYAVFALKSPGFAFCVPVGLLIAAGLFSLYRISRIWWIRTAIVAAIVSSYPLFGIFSLLAAAMCGLHSISYTIYNVHTTKAPWNYLYAVAAAVSIAGIAVLPGWWFTHFGGHLPEVAVYITPLPIFLPDEGSLSLPVKACFIFLGIAALLTPLWKKDAGKGWRKVAGISAAAAMYAASLALLFFARYSDYNFFLTLRLDRALTQQRWQDAVDDYMGITEQPTRLNNLLAYAALLRTGRAPECIFSLPVGCAPYNTSETRARRVMHEIGAPVISYHLGMTAFAYRWNFENLVEYGMNPYNLSLLARCATLNGETALAEKYAAALQRCPMHSAEGTTDAQSEELRSIAALADSRSLFHSESGYYELYIWPFLSKAGKTDSAEKNDLTLLCSLVFQDQQTFIDTLTQVYPPGSRLPRHFAEALLLWDATKGTTLSKDYQIDESMRKRFLDFLNAYNKSKKRSADFQARSLRDSFGDTYWYYYTCVKDLDII